MIDVTHFHDGGSWAFQSPIIPGFVGGGSSFEKSVEAAEHAFRQHMSRVQGRSVPLDEARESLRHLDGSGTVEWIGAQHWNQQARVLANTG